MSSRITQNLNFFPSSDPPILLNPDLRFHDVTVVPYFPFLIFLVLFFGFLHSNIRFAKGAYRQIYLVVAQPSRFQLPSVKAHAVVTYPTPPSCAKTKTAVCQAQLGINRYTISGSGSFLPQVSPTPTTDIRSSRNTNSSEPIGTLPYHLTTSTKKTHLRNSSTIPHSLIFPLFLRAIDSITSLVFGYGYDYYCDQFCTYNILAKNPQEKYRATCQHLSRSTDRYCSTTAKYRGTERKTPLETNLN